MNTYKPSSELQRAAEQRIANAERLAGYRRKQLAILAKLAPIAPAGDYVIRRQAG